MSHSHSFDKHYLEDGKGFKSWFLLKITKD